MQIRGWLLTRLSSHSVSLNSSMLTVSAFACTQVPQLQLAFSSKMNSKLSCKGEPWLLLEGEEIREIRFLKEGFSRRMLMSLY